MSVIWAEAAVDVDDGALLLGNVLSWERCATTQLGHICHATNLG